MGDHVAAHESIGFDLLLSLASPAADTVAENLPAALGVRPGTEAPSVLPELDGPAEPRSRRSFHPVSALLPLILAIQACLSFHLVWSNTAFQDEALYLWAGRLEWAHVLHGAPIPPFATYFSGAPVIYPPLAALADGIGGLAGARLLSLIFMLGTTGLLWGTTRRLFGRTAAVYAAAIFAILGPVLHIGAFATFDAMALFLIALSVWCTARAGSRQDSTMWMFAAAAALALANACAYSSAIFDPVVIVFAVLVAHPSPAGRLARARGAAVLTYTTAVIVVLVKIGGHWYARGISQTVLTRIVGTSSPSLIIHQTAAWIGVVVALSAVSVVVAAVSRERRHQIMMLGVLLVAGLLVPLQQARIHTDTSLDKHLAYGVWFAAIAVGYMVSRLVTRSRARALRVILATVCAAAIVPLGFAGMSTGHQLFATWPNAAQFIRAFKPLADSTTGPLLVETPSLAEFYTTAGNRWQRWSSTSEITKPDGASIGASVGKTLKAARYASLIQRGYFTLVALNFGGTAQLDHAILSDLKRNSRYQVVAKPVYGNRHYTIWMYESGRSGR